MLKIQQNPKFLIDVAEEIIDILMEGTIQEESIRFEIGKKLFQLEERMLQKRKHHYKIIAEEILKQLPNQPGISPTELLEMKRFYRAKAHFLEEFSKRKS
jgi:hypothetical protein